jgi:hypothetical protein
MELGVFGLVHHTHAATPEFIEDPVVGNGLAQHGHWLASGKNKARLHPFARIVK